jgi:hypothetical protein
LLIPDEDEVTVGETNSRFSFVWRVAIVSLLGRNEVIEVSIFLFTPTASALVPTLGMQQKCRPKTTRLRLF